MPSACLALVSSAVASETLVMAPSSRIERRRKDLSSEAGSGKERPRARSGMARTSDLWFSRYGVLPPSGHAAHHPCTTRCRSPWMERRGIARSETVTWWGMAALRPCVPGRGLIGQPPAADGPPPFHDASVLPVGYSQALTILARRRRQPAPSPRVSTRRRRPAGPGLRRTGIVAGRAAPRVAARLAFGTRSPTVVEAGDYRSRARSAPGGRLLAQLRRQLHRATRHQYRPAAHRSLPGVAEPSPSRFDPS
jgi:hypothetical protein